MEYFAFITGLLYLILEIRQNSIMWVVGGISAIAYIIVFAESSLFAAMGLQVYYAAVSLYGFYRWREDKRLSKHREKDAERGAGKGDEIIYRHIGMRDLLLSVLLFAAVFVSLLTFLRNMTGDPMPLADALATALSIVATWWLSRSYICQWLLWVCVNILSAYLFFSQELYLTAILYLIYTVCALYGFYHWHKCGVLIKK